MTSELPATAVVRVSQASFDAARFAEIDQMSKTTGDYLIPAIQKLEGLLAYYAERSPDGSMVHVSLWDSDEHAQQMGSLKEMIVDARGDFDAVGATFVPIVDYPLSSAHDNASSAANSALAKVGHAPDDDLKEIVSRAAVSVFPDLPGASVPAT